VALLAVQVVRGFGDVPESDTRDGPTDPRGVTVQPNVAQDQRGDSDQAMMLARLTRLSGRPGAAPRLVLWPEGVIRDFIEDDYP
ncbi:hypothetical protein K4H02_25880, partial [Mycobacterium tuberculosis]|nr:hypothetical protein [Mycobacterium tuberculosis]